MVQLAPSILSADFSLLAEEILAAEKAGVEMLHLDIMDGHFVPNITLGPSLVKAIRPKSKLLFDVHLMIENPDQYIPDFIQAGADIISVHAEACPHLHRTIQNIKEQGVKAAVALNPATPLTVLEYVLPQIDMILLMTVNPGFGGQKFISAVIPKIVKARQMIIESGLKIDLEVDGGINTHTAKEVVKSGANVLVAGSAVFGQPNIADAVKNLRAAALDN
ncbi:ribulose-phosphate 3-epimerase [Bacillota bacterium LX-D]|nr:ribulose-phosphate 3-epimerase [Bacillota bacterium LX-D]